jgi:exosortase F-associated protein
MMESARSMQQPDSLIKRICLSVLALVILASVYIFQHTSLTSLMISLLDQSSWRIHPNLVFAINRAARLVLNDLACFILIYAFFQDRKYLKVAFWVFLVELLVILPLYLSVKLSLEGDSEISSPLLSQIHRLIVNPTLMILLIMGFFYQKLTYKKG